MDRLQNEKKQTETKNKITHFLLKTGDFDVLSALFGGDKRDRTADLLNAIQALSQLSYTPE